MCMYVYIYIYNKKQELKLMPLADHSYYTEEMFPNSAITHAVVNFPNMSFC